MIGLDVPDGTRTQVEVRRSDGGEFWKETAIARSERPLIPIWMPPGRGHSLSITESFPDGGSCTAFGKLNASDREDFVLVYVERLDTGGCRVVDEPPWKDAAPRPLRGDFPPYSTLWINQPPKAQ